MGRPEIAIAVDVGGTKIAAAAINDDALVLTSVRAETPQTNADEVVHAITSLIDKLIEPASRVGDVVGIGLSVAGTVDWRRGSIIQSPNLPLTNIELRDIIEAQFRMTTRLDNDGNCAALGERFCGSATGSHDVVGLTLGTGIGAGILIDGRLYRGATGSAAELGHMVIEASGPVCTCGSHGCFEEMASGRALVRIAKEKAVLKTDSLLYEAADGDVSKITGPLVTDAARQGDTVALEAFSEIGYWLGIGINNIINIFNPEIVIIGGGMAEAGELVLAPARQVVKAHTLYPNKDVALIVLGKLGNSAGLLGAAALIFDK